MYIYDIFIVLHILLSVISLNLSVLILSDILSVGKTRVKPYTIRRLCKQILAHAAEYILTRPISLSRYHLAINLEYQVHYYH